VQGARLCQLRDGFFGGMAGCAMIGQSVNQLQVRRARAIVVLSRRARLSVVLILVLGRMGAPDSDGRSGCVMFMVSIGTFDWAELQQHEASIRAANRS
jgi:SulP family sulfate permease